MINALTLYLENFIDAHKVLRLNKLLMNYDYFIKVTLIINVY